MMKFLENRSNPSGPGLVNLLVTEKAAIIKILNGEF
jgi:hypothetical protein